jgi:hypothetical protein
MLWKKNRTTETTRGKLVEGEGFEPSKAEPPDLQSGPVDRWGNPSTRTAIMPRTISHVKHLSAIYAYYFISQGKAII